MSAADWNPPVQWTPKHLVDEITPPPRASPTDWIVGLAPASTAYVIAGFGDDAELGETTTTLAVGETMLFSPFREFNSIFVTVQPDGTWDTSDPIRSEADHFCAENGDFIGGSVSEVVSQFQNADERRDEIAELRVDCYHWGEAQTFRLAISAETGKAEFVPVSDEVGRAIQGTPKADLPPSLAVTPNIPWDRQTLDQLRQEHAYWTARIADASGFASAKAADDFRKACETWIARREHEAAA